jgi:hypothetical protein
MLMGLAMVEQPVQGTDLKGMETVTHAVGRRFGEGMEVVA